ncbi:LysR substrate-binding domain-containing protein [Mesorhizobium sp. B2-3-4]|uniref:LysR substrate-binding domain-containing protein n=1 Tax=Mesorhizobium sp. B2-3-4 TaxID=2589959 RepID=UPI0011275450|nr:LysR substrate-binding domain-containing protein [Mesorhizobium sp. B2-3-4]TPM28112.1 LysR family transcriptional regulator [Mesorhizobium sp. B2-3-4]
MSRPTFNELEAFRAVAAHRSFRHAADAIGVSRSALSHTIIGLEKTLGVRLLNRTTRSVSPTDAGARLLRLLEPIMHDLDAALDELAEDRGAPNGTLRINANKAAAMWLLSRIVPGFLSRHPGIELDLVSEGRLVDIVHDGFDAGVRLADAIPQDMIAVPLGGPTRFVAVAAPAYLAANKPPVTPEDLKRHVCIRQRLPSGKRYLWEFGKGDQELSVDVPGVLSLDDNSLMVQAAVNGMGIAYVPQSFAEDELRNGQLVTVLTDWCPSIPGLALYYPGYRHVPSTLRAFIDAIRHHQRDAKAR